ncbi:MAG TPA: sensor histidine kinase [Candidatus Cloacimonadota bacterium]|mgnify:CR=1 FL=1|nr:sensor histidine kinase [Candidatus Cloacimonadota bacterium]HOQ79847.1 sensor histidine kinase [Candidatus Cloacimonadota bacterium]HPK40345.1 sensor histidine kinase [Candidatus Cloacimonadota bacterium]
MQDLSLHLIDIIENSARANCDLISIVIGIDETENKLSFEIIDNGVGMDEDTLTSAQNPFYTSKSERKKKIGLGIPLFKENAERCNGSFLMESTIGKGTRLYAEFEHNHIDRMPLGSIEDTFLSSIVGHSEINFFIKLFHILQNKEEKVFILDTREIKSELGDIPITWPDVVIYLKDTLNEGIKNIELEEF